MVCIYEYRAVAVMVAKAPGVALLHRFSSIVDIKAGIALNKTFVKLISW